MILSFRPLDTPRSLLFMLRIATLLLIFISATSAFSQEIVIYPKPESLTDTRSDYPVALLQMCEKKKPNQFHFQASNISSQQGRSLWLLSQNRGIDIAWMLTTREREKELLPIRIPIDRGLIGWRLALISKKNKALFERQSSPAQLANLRAGQGHDWPDVEILRNANFKVSTNSSYEGLFTMLATGHVDYFPRSVEEIWPELDSHQQLGLMADTKWALHYPAALYFFVNKNNIALATNVEACLMTAIQDGSLQAIFNHYFDDAVEKAAFSNRKIIHLKNPLLPEATPLDKKEFWYSPLK